MICAIPLGLSGQHEAVVDAGDYAWLARWRWHAKASRNRGREKVYARRNTWRGGQRITLYMHTEILEFHEGVKPSESHTVDHLDGDGLNNRRANLRWASKREQSNNQTGRTPVFQSEPQEVPF